MLTKQREQVGMLAKKLDEFLADGQISEEESKYLLEELEDLQNDIESLETEDEDEDEVKGLTDLQEIGEYIEEILEDGEITPEEAQELADQINEELEQYVTADEPIVSFSEVAADIKTMAGAGMLELGEMLGYEDAGEFIAELAQVLGTTVSYIAEIVSGDRYLTPEFAEALVNMLEEKAMLDPEQAEALFLDLIECGDKDKAEKLAYESKYSDIYNRDRYLETEDLHKVGRLREYGRALLEKDDREKELMQNDRYLQQQLKNMQYSLGELQNEIQFDRDYEELADRFEDQRIRAETLVERGILTPTKYAYYFGNREFYPDKHKLIAAFAEKAKHENTSLIAEFNINERLLSDLEQEQTSIFTDYMGKVPSQNGRQADRPWAGFVEYYNGRNTTKN